VPEDGSSGTLDPMAHGGDARWIGEHEEENAKGYLALPLDSCRG
jgi:hypothetical protein